jgi:hypothetical protein
VFSNNCLTVGIETLKCFDRTLADVKGNVSIDAWFYIVCPSNAKTARYHKQAFKIYNQIYLPKAGI